MGDEKTQKLTLHGLQSARGFLQAKIAEGLQLRYTPILQFQLDQGVKRSIEASRLLREVLPSPPAEAADDFETEESSPTEDDVSESPLSEEGCAGHVSPVLPITKSPYERHTENQDG